MQPGTGLHPTNFESRAGAAFSLTTVPTGKNAEQVPPEPLPRVIVQSIPAGEEVTRPLPLPPGRIETLPLLNANGVQTVTMSYVVTVPAVPMMSADWLFGTTVVAIGKLALVAPAGTVTLGGTVAAAVLSLERETTKPLAGAAVVSVAVPVDGSPPTTSFGLTRMVESDAVDDGGGFTVQPASVALVAVAEPSFTSRVQSAGAAKGSRWILKFPAPSLVPIAAPSTVIVRFAIAVPSRRSCVPFSSARDTRTSAEAGDAATAAPTSSSRTTTARLLAPF